MSTDDEALEAIYTAREALRAGDLDRCEDALLLAVGRVRKQRQEARTCK